MTFVDTQGVQNPLELIPQILGAPRNPVGFVSLSAFTELAKQRAKEHLDVAERLQFAWKGVWRIGVCMSYDVGRRYFG